MSVKISEMPIDSGIKQISDDTSNKDNDKVSGIENNENNNPIINDDNKKNDELIDAATHSQSSILGEGNINKDDDNTLGLKKRGRPKGSLNKPRAKATESRVKAKKPDAIHSQREDDDTTLDTGMGTEAIPAYVQQSPEYTMPQPQDLASQLFGLLQRHEHERTNRRRATYASWMTRF